MARFAAFLLSALSVANVVVSLGQNATIAFDDAPGRLLLGDKSTAVRIIVDDTDWKGVKRVAQDLAHDFGRVTGINGSATAVGTSCLAKGLGNGTADGGVIIAGTLGKSKLIDDLVSAGKVNVGAVKGYWEAFSSQIVISPCLGVDKALVIAGELQSLVSPGN